MKKAKQLLEAIREHPAKGHILDVLSHLENDHISSEDAHAAVAHLVHTHDLTLSELAEIVSHIQTKGSVREEWDDYETKTDKAKRVGRAVLKGAAVAGLAVPAIYSVAHPISRHILGTAAKQVGGAYLHGVGHVATGLGAAAQIAAGHASHGLHALGNTLQSL